MDKMSLCLGDVLMKYSVFVCEDPKIKLDLYHLVKLAITIQEDIIHEKISFDGVYTDPNKLLDHIEQEAVNYGIYFLTTSIFAGKMGLELAKKIKLIDASAQLILVTDDISKVYLAFENNVELLDCISSKQPIYKIQERLNDAVLSAVKRQDLEGKRKQTIFYYRNGQCAYAENLDNIVCITTTTKPRRLCLETLTGTHEINGSLQQFATAYPMLWRISQSCLVNDNNICLIDLKSHKVLFSNGEFEYYSKRAIKVIREILRRRVAKKSSFRGSCRYVTNCFLWK